MEGGPAGDGPFEREEMKRGLAILLVVAAAACDRKAGNGSPPAPAPPPSDAQAAIEAWKTWVACAAAGDGARAWACLSKRTRAERASLYRADAARIRRLSGSSLDAEARSWGVAADKLAAAGPEDLAILALTREFRRPGGASVSRIVETSVSLEGDVARVTSEGRPQPIALVREDGGWKLDDTASRAQGR
ncbi:MAG: hypothetical protein FD180_1761 [Planctomycetota bacterium]|nr:MAG: hypothetical protein FD180_1761 [Planctomycetota bacterium]